MHKLSPDLKHVQELSLDRKNLKKETIINILNNAHDLNRLYLGSWSYIGNKELENLAEELMLAK